MFEKIQNGEEQIQAYFVMTETHLELDKYYSLNPLSCIKPFVITSLTADAIIVCRKIGRLLKKVLM